MSLKMNFFFSLFPSGFSTANQLPPLLPPIFPNLRYLTYFPLTLLF